MSRFSINKQSQNEVRSLIHRLRSYRLVRNLLIGFILVSICNLLFSSLFYTPKMFRLADEKRELKLKYEILQNRIRSSQRILDEIRHRDNYVYRPLFSTDTLSIEGIYNPYEEAKYADINGGSFTPTIREVWKDMDQLARSLYLQSKSLDELQQLSKDKEKFSTAIPAIWPIDRTTLRAFYPFGERSRHPIYGTRAMHKGVDLSANYGAPVFATGDGIVEKVDQGRPQFGYGQQILIDHKFGYKTRYAHLQRMFVKRGQKVQRGQLIGEVGSTGGSTGPHLHYEVLLRNKNVNPINYFNLNMTKEEYRELVKSIRYNADLESGSGIPETEQ